MKPIHPSAREWRKIWKLFEEWFDAHCSGEGEECDGKRHTWAKQKQIIQSLVNGVMKDRESP